MRQVLLLAVSLLVLLATPGWARSGETAVRYVDCVNGDDGSDGLSWMTAVGSVEAAFGSLPGCAWNPEELPCIAGFEVNVASGVCEMPQWIDMPTTGGVVRGMGRDLTRLTSSWNYPSEFRIRVQELSPLRRYSFESMSTYRVSLDASGGVITIADMDLQGVIVTRGDLRVQNSTLWSVFLQQGESIDISDSIVGAGVGVLHAFSVGEGTTRRMVIVRLDRNVLMAGTGTAVNLLAFTDARITAILHDNVVMGPVNTYGNVTIAGDQR